MTHMSSDGTMGLKFILVYPHRLDVGAIGIDAVAPIHVFRQAVRQTFRLPARMELNILGSNGQLIHPCVDAASVNQGFFETGKMPIMNATQLLAICDDPSIRERPSKYRRMNATTF